MQDTEHKALGVVLRRIYALACDFGMTELVADAEKALGLVEDVRTPREWLKLPAYQGMEIMDADGWRDKPFDQVIGFEEFKRRLVECTVLYHRGTFPKSYRAEGVNFVD